MGVAWEEQGHRMNHALINRVDQGKTNSTREENAPNNY